MKVNNRVLIPILLLIVLISGCKKVDELGEGDYIVFGSSYGNCITDCIRVYKLDNTKIQEDEDSTYIGLVKYLIYKFNGTMTLDEINFNQVKHLLNEIPSELSSGTNKIFGCPDCADGGAIYIEVNIDGVNSRFLLDGGYSSDQSLEISVFKLKILEAINILKN